MEHFKSLKNWISESSIKIPPSFNSIFRIKNKWVPIGKLEREKIVENFYELVNTAYYAEGGHLKVKSKEDMLRDDWDVWFAQDLDIDPQADVVIFGKRTPFGIKIVGVGHDGARESIRESLLYRVKLLTGKGTYLETSSKPYMILHNKFNINIIKDPKIVQTVLNKPIRWYGEHPKGKDGDPYGNPYWYSRKIGDKVVLKIMMGNPLLDGLKI